MTNNKVKKIFSFFKTVFNAFKFKLSNDASLKIIGLAKKDSKIDRT